MEKDTTETKNGHGEGTKDRKRKVPIECNAVLHGFKAESKEKYVTSVIEDSYRATGMKEEYAIDCPTIPLTHAFVEFQTMKIRDSYVRPANMREIELDGRRIKISPVLEAEERFDRKILGFINFAINKEKGIALHYIQMKYEKKSITIDGQLIVKI